MTTKNSPSLLSIFIAASSVVGGALIAATIVVHDRNKTLNENLKVKIEKKTIELEQALLLKDVKIRGLEETIKANNEQADRDIEANKREYDFAMDQTDKEHRLEIEKLKQTHAEERRSWLIHTEQLMEARAEDQQRCFELKEENQELKKWIRAGLGKPHITWSVSK